MYKLIQQPGEPRTPRAAALALAEKCPEHMRENLSERWRKGYSEYDKTGGPEVWYRGIDKSGILPATLPKRIRHRSLMEARDREKNDAIAPLTYVQIPQPWVPKPETDPNLGSATEK